MPEIAEGAHKHSPPDDSRTILRVPSLATAGSSETPSSGPDAQDKDHSRDSACSSFSGTSPTNPRHRSPFGHRGGSVNGWSTSPSPGRANVGPPIYVNYRPEDMMTESWAAHSAYTYSGKQPHPQPLNSSTAWMHGQGPPPTPHGSSNLRNNGAPQGMPPYSPIRIRSGRGARRLSNASTIRHASSSESVSTTVMPAAPARTFPVSNRGGKGRRTLMAPVLSSNNSTTSASATMIQSIADGSEALTMLAKMGEQHQQEQQQQQLLMSHDVTPVDEADRRCGLKRKLPLSTSSSRTPTPAVDAATGE